MNTSMRRHLPLLLATLAFLSTTTVQAESGQEAGCMRCHSMKTLAYLDSKTGGVRNLSIDPDAMARSDHKKLGCRSCHGAGFEVYPHFKEARLERLECLNCHKENIDFPHELFESIERSFERSVHFQTLPDSFTCFSCHDPHDFRSLSKQPNEELTTVVARDNGVCRRCHDTPNEIYSKTGRKFSPLVATHAWLPEAERHWDNVRCVECHTGPKSNRSHFILGRNDAVRACEACHSQNSLLVAKLYRHRLREEKRSGTLTNSSVMNNAYVIGLTRHPWLDWGGIALIVMTFLGVTGHGLARWLFTRRDPHENHH
ncbi:MAG: cytochrome c3 family protein [Magnetococcales bacterium]|nr:cytochrome c3 family protein [Magnetococcales bacterium]